MEQIVIYGAGALARKIIKYNWRYSLFDIIALIDDNSKIEAEKWGVPVWGYQQFKQLYKKGDAPSIIVSIGYTGCNRFREDVILRLMTDGYKLGNFISPGANCWPDTIRGCNILVFDNAFIGDDCELANGVVICPGCVLSHGVHVEDYVFFSDGVVVGGNARIGKNSFVGLNSTIKSSVNVGKYNIIGSAANVLKDTEGFMVTKGNPGRSVIGDTLNMKI